MPEAFNRGILLKSIEADSRGFDETYAEVDLEDQLYARGVLGQNSPWKVQ
jgi:hypothetical protein